MADKRRKRYRGRNRKKYFEPNWQIIQGGGGNYTDFWGRKEPSQADLIHAWRDVVYSCTKLIASTVASTPIKLYVKTDPGQAKPKCLTSKVDTKTRGQLGKVKALSGATAVDEVVSHAALDLLQEGSPAHDYSQLIRLTQLYLDICGNAYWLVKPDEYGIPTGLFILPAHRMHPERDEVGIIRAWKCGEGLNSVTYTADEIIHFKEDDPADPYGLGVSPLKGVWDRAQIGHKELGYLDATLSNMARPDVLITPKDPISVFEAERFAKDYQQRYQGSGNGGAYVATDPVDLKPITFPPRDLAELELYKVIKTSVCNAFGIPPDVFELGQSNRASAEAVLYSLAMHCIKPRMELIVAKLNRCLIPHFDRRLFFAAPAIVPEDRQFELTVIQALVAAGVVTREEVREKYGYEPAEWAREPLLPPGAMPASAVAPELPDEEPAPELPAPVDRSGQAPAIAALQQSYYGGQLPREAVISNLVFSFGLTTEEAARLVPEKAPEPPADPAPAPAAPELSEDSINRLAELVAGGLKKKALEVPDVRQQADYDCGAAATLAVCQFFGVGPSSEDEVAAALGTNPEEGTDPEAIAGYLESVGLEAVALDGLSIEDLYQLTESGSPVIVAIQAYEDKPEDIARETAGHYVIVCGVEDVGEQIELTLQDPSAGRITMGATDFLARWQDREEAGRYVHYGIAASKPAAKALRRKARPGRIKRKGPEALQKALAAFFKHQHKAILGKLKAIDPEQVTTKALDPLAKWFDVEQWDSAMFEAMRPTVALYFDHASKQTISRIGASWDLLKVVQPKLAEAIDKATLTFCEETNRTTSMELDKALTALRSELTEGAQAGEVQNELTKRVQSVFEGAEVYRAYRIAHTESARAQHSGLEIVAKESGLVTGLRWILSDDACPLCLPLANKTVALGESFAHDANMGPYADIQYPPRHPLCRCTVQEIIPDVND